jgi:hypothetical protein
VIPFPAELIDIVLGVHPVPELRAQTFQIEKTARPFRLGDRRGGFTDDPLGETEPLAQGERTNLQLVEVVGRRADWLWHGGFS